jgi:hypothetical protein
MREVQLVLVQKPPILVVGGFLMQASRIFTSILVALLTLSYNLRAGNAIDINQEEYQKFVEKIDSTLQQSPPPWDSYKIVGGELVLPSGAKFKVSEIERMSALSYDDLLADLSKKGLAVKVLCDSRPNYIKQIQKTPCNKKEEFNEEFLKQNINAQYVSEYSTINKANKPELLLRVDAPFYSVIHEYIHHLQETVPAPFIKKYRLKSLRVALGDSIFEKGEKKRDDLDKLVFQQLRLVQWLLDETENYAAMVKFYKIFKLHFSDVHEIMWKLSSYVSQCRSKKCKGELEKAQNFFASAQEAEVKARVPLSFNLELSDDLISEQVAKQASAKSYEEWFKAVKAKVYEKNNLKAEQEASLKLYEKLNQANYPYKDKKEGFERLLSWMAKNAVIQQHILSRALELEKGNLKFKAEMMKDREYFASYLKP